MRSARLPAVLIAAALAVAAPHAARAQSDVLDLGVHAARADHVFDGTTGVGGQLGLRVPGIPLTVRGAVERFFPDCSGIGVSDDCGAWGFTVDANVALPVPVLSPYLSAGLVRRSLDLGGEVAETREIGMALGAGLQLKLLGLTLFGEGRREIMERLDDEWMFRAGILF